VALLSKLEEQINQVDLSRRATTDNAGGRTASLNDIEPTMVELLNAMTSAPGRSPLSGLAPLLR
jgi:hypothetical protein